MLTTQNNKQLIEQDSEQYKRIKSNARILAASVNRFKSQVEFVGDRPLSLADVVDFERDVLSAYVAVTTLMSVYSEYHYLLNLSDQLCQSPKVQD